MCEYVNRETISFGCTHTHNLFCKFTHKMLICIVKLFFGHFVLLSLTHFLTLSPTQSLFLSICVPFLTQTLHVWLYILYLLSVDTVSGFDNSTEKQHTFTHTYLYTHTTHTYGVHHSLIPKNFVCQILCIFIFFSFFSLHRLFISISLYCLRFLLSHSQRCYSTFLSDWICMGVYVWQSMSVLYCTHRMLLLNVIRKLNTHTLNENAVTNRFIPIYSNVHEQHTNNLTCCSYVYRTHSRFSYFHMSM